MKISYIKSIRDNTSFKFFKISENDYKTFFITNEVAGHSQDLFKKYYNSKDINIIIAKTKN